MASSSRVLSVGRNRAAHRVLPMLVLDDEQALVLGTHAREQRLEADRVRMLVGALDPVGGPAAQVIPFRIRAVERQLAIAEFLEIVRRAHAADVEEVLVLPDALLAVGQALALVAEAIDR